MTNYGGDNPRRFASGWDSHTKEAMAKTIDLPFTPEDVRNGKLARSEAVSFTVPASGRRYQIHIADWESIKLHMGMAEAARAAVQETTE